MASRFFQRLRPTPKSTMDSTWSHAEDKVDSNDITSGGQPAIFKILNAAAQYSDMMSDETDESPDDSGDDQDAKLGLKRTESDLSSLDPEAMSSVARFVKLAVNNYIPEPTHADGSSSSDDSVDLPTSLSATTSRSSGRVEDPETVLRILQNEFGVLTVPDELMEDGEQDKEELLCTGDAAFFQDIVILGVAHFTTHRLTFHASLLSTRPELQTILKAGPVIVHRKGLIPKRRVWVELTQELLTTFANASDEARVRPIRAILLSALKDVFPHNPAEPRIVRINVQVEKGIVHRKLEFDTEESELEWRQELTAALYLFRHRRRSIVGRDSDSSASQGSDNTPLTDQPGVRISIPLHRVATVTSEKYLNIFQTVTLTFNDTEIPADEEDADVASLASGDSKFSTLPSGIQSLSLGFMRPDDHLKQFSECVRKGKERRAKARSKEVIKPGDPECDSSERDEAQRELDRRRVLSNRIIVDFGALSFSEVTPKAGEGASTEKIPAAQKTENRVRELFGISSERDIWLVRCNLIRFISTSGYLVVSDRFICFWGKSFATQDIKYRFTTRLVHAAKPLKLSGFSITGLVLEIEGQKDLRFEFPKEEARDKTVRRINSVLSAAKASAPSSDSNSDSTGPSSFLGDQGTGVVSASPTGARTPEECASTAVAILAPISQLHQRSKTTIFDPAILPLLPKAINMPPETFRGISPRHFVCLTIGSRGDVQPYIALGLGLIKQGHRVTIVTHEEYKIWVEAFGIAHRTAGGDPAALMKLSVDHSLFSPQFFKESLGHFRGWLDDLLLDSWKQCQDADVLIESPSAMAGIHIAEALHIPYFRAFTMPWSRTSEYPHAFLSPPFDLQSPSFNYSTYVLFDNIMWKATSGQINRWRRKTLQLKNTDISHLAQTKIPFIYNFSPSVVPKPLDWKDTTIVSGYWFLDTADVGWVPPPSLNDFMNKARQDGKPLVYIGFGSIVVPKPHAMTRTIIKAVLKSDVRAIISKGWSARLSSDEGPDVEMPPECYQVDKIPHDWLFPKIDAAVHHGGAGTTGASLRAGIPTLIKPWFGDQYFWASRVQKLGAGLRIANLNSSDLSEALTTATTDRVMKEKAAIVGEKIRAENGVNVAIQNIFTYLPRAAQDRTTLH